MFSLNSGEPVNVYLGLFVEHSSVQELCCIVPNVGTPSHSGQVSNGKLTASHDSKKPWTQILQAWIILMVMCKDNYRAIVTKNEKQEKKKERNVNNLFIYFPPPSNSK